MPSRPVARRMCFSEGVVVEKTVIALALVVAFTASPAQAAQQDDLRELREQLRQLKEQYESRIQALERRLEQVQASGSASASRPAEAAPPQAASRPAAENAFNPAVSLI